MAVSCVAAVARLVATPSVLVSIAAKFADTPAVLVTILAVLAVMAVS
jgi:hypothetical protein